MADDLAAWLTQIWDEQEAQAKAATVSPWRYHPQRHTRLPGTAFFEEGVFAGETGAAATTIAATGETDDPQSMADAAFIAANDPASVLARIAADRQILADYLDACRSYTIERTPFREGQRFGLLLALARLAEAHADRPGFQEEWRP